MINNSYCYNNSDYPPCERGRPLGQRVRVVQHVDGHEADLSGATLTQTHTHNNIVNSMIRT